MVFRLRVDFQGSPHRRMAAWGWAVHGEMVENWDDVLFLAVYIQAKEQKKLVRQ